MTAAALLVVVGAAWLMDLGGLSMAMAAFLAGVLLSESTFRHQLEADVGALPRHPAGPVLPQRRHVAERRRGAGPTGGSCVGGVIAFMAVKAVAIYAVARIFKASERARRSSAPSCSPRGVVRLRPVFAALATGVFDARVSAAARPSSSCPWR